MQTEVLTLWNSGFQDPSYRHPHPLYKYGTLFTQTGRLYIRLPQQFNSDFFCKPSGRRSEKIVLKI